MNTEPATNGESTHQKTESAIARELQEDATVGYRPTLPLESLWLSGAGDVPQVTLRRDIEFMLMHPVVTTTMEYFKSGTAGTEFWGGPDDADPANHQGKPISADPRVSEFVLSHVERFWRGSVPLIQEGGYSYGWAPGEHIYKEVGGQMVWDHLKVFHPNDGFILTLDHRAIGVRVKGIRDTVKGNTEGGQVSLWLASGSIPAKGLWYSHRPRFNQYYGRSQLIGAWRPWRRLGWRDAVEQVIDAAIYRAGYKGPVVRHPKEDAQTALSGVPATTQDGRGMPRRSARDVARQIVEWAKAGAGFTLSSEMYPSDQGGGPKWSIEWPEHVMDVRPLIEAARYLEDQIMLGIGVPPELLKAGGTGSGYSGRNIPREAFLNGQQYIADALLYNFVEQVLRPLVLWNFGDVPFNIACKSLLKSQSEDRNTEEQGTGIENNTLNYNRSQAAKDAWARRKAAQRRMLNPQAGPPMSLEEDAEFEEYRRRILGIVQRVLRRAA